MFSTYRAVFRAPGSAAFCAAGFVARFPIAVYPIGLVLLASSRTGDYGFAGLLGASYLIGAAPGNQLLARLVDRFGQRRVLLPAEVAHIVCVVVLGLLFSAGAPDWALVPPTVLAGFGYVSIGPLVRSRWSLALAGTDQLSAAYSLESTLDELIFVLGPLAATLIATQLRPVLVLYVAIVLIAVGGVWLSALRGTEPPPHPAGAPRPPTSLRATGVPLLVALSMTTGATFATAEVTMVAFCGQHHERGLSGACLAAMAGGSAVAGLLYGTRTWRRTLLDRFRTQALLFAVLPAVFLAAVNVGVLLVCAFAVGLTIAPLLIGAFGLTEQIVPAASLTEGLTWLTTGLNVGYGIGSATVGAVADAAGARVAFALALGCSLATGLIGLALHRALSASGAPGMAPSEDAALP